jgi:hypothetical protein
MMTANDQGSRSAASNSADEVGKVFVAIAQGVRRCLICDGAFTGQGAAEHSDAVCYPCQVRS